MNIVYVYGIFQRYMAAGERVELSETPQQGFLEIAGHRFEIVDLTPQDKIRFFCPLSRDSRGLSLPAAEFRGISPDQISRSEPAKYSDGYQFYTDLTVVLVINGEPTQPQTVETKQSPATYFGGRIARLQELVENALWRVKATAYLRDGYDRAVIIPSQLPGRPNRPNIPAIYPLGPHDLILPSQ